VLAALFECSDNRGTAVKIEKYIKKQKSLFLIEKMISGEILSGDLAQLVSATYELNSEQLTTAG